MFAPNAVDPSTSTRIVYDGPFGQHAHLPARDDERGALDVVRMLGLASLLVVAYVVGGIAGARPTPVTTNAPVPVEQDGGIGGPAQKQGAAPVIRPAVGEFRLGPGNNQAPGLVTAPVARPVVGEFRLGPGNNQAPGLVTAPVTGPVRGEFRLGPGNDPAPGVVGGGDLPAGAILPIE